MSKKTENFYNRFSFFYPLVDIFLKPQKRKLCRAVNELPEGSLLEIGVGNGSHLRYYTRHNLTGIDTSPAMLKRATRQAGRNTVLIQMNGEKLGFDDSQFDYVVLSHVIAVVDHPDKMLEEVYRVLKPGGRLFILNHFTPGNALRYVDHLFSKLSSLFHFKSAFHVENLYAIKKFTALKEMQMGWFSYFKLLIYTRN